MWMRTLSGLFLFAQICQFPLPFHTLNFISFSSPYPSLDPPESPDTWFSVSQNHRPEKPPKMPSVSGYPGYNFSPFPSFRHLSSSCYLCFCIVILFCHSCQSCLYFSILVVTVPSLAKTTSLSESPGLGVVYSSLQPRR